MISDFLDQSYVLAQTRAQRDWLSDLVAKANAKKPEALAALKKHGVTLAQIKKAIAAIDFALKAADKLKHDKDKAFIPSIPMLCAFQTGMSQMADKRANTVSTPSAEAPVKRLAPSRGVSSKKAPLDTSATEHLKRRSDAGASRGSERSVLKAPFVEGDDIHYGLDGFKAKFGALFTGRHSFNKNPAVPAVSTQPLRLFIFGDWGTGLPLAQQVTQQIQAQLDAADASRQNHVVHLGDVYYVGDPDEYSERVLAAGMWPVSSSEKDKIGSWSLNGNHDMYTGGHGYFDKLLSEGRFLRWHRDASGKPSSFFVIEDADWQFFGLDTAWNLPSLINTVVGKPTAMDYGGQNGIITKEQAKWMAAQRDASKGCVLLTHHQAAASRKSEGQHSDESVLLLKKEGVYAQIDAWIWGHEHRCVVFKPKAQRTSKRLKDAPDFCACIGHGGVPVTAKNFELNNTLADVAWQEDRLDASSPIYEGERILPFGFARIETAPGALDIRIFDHSGSERYKSTFTRPSAIAAPTRTLTTSTRSIRKPAATNTKKAKKKIVKKSKPSK